MMLPSEIPTKAMLFAVEIGVRRSPGNPRSGSVRVSAVVSATAWRMWSRAFSGFETLSICQPLSICPSGANTPTAPTLSMLKWPLVVAERAARPLVERVRRCP